MSDDGLTNHVVSTAGHVDHGKSTLVRALTGTDPDRWREEKDRGLTIDLGFAATSLPSGRTISFVDVPGHERFIRNMLAGVGAVDACVFVVSASEGWKPQSEEHLRILDLLGVSAGLVALTKVGTVDDDLRELATLDVEEHVVGTFLEGSPIIAVDAVDGVGMEELREALDTLLAVTPTAADTGRPRLWIDRAFAAKGSGTVVTGTLTGGTITVDDDLSVLPAGHRVRVRALQSHNAELAIAIPGSRVAVNLSGVGHDDVGRGDVLVRAEQWHQTTRVDASLTVLDRLDHDVSRRGAHVAYIGSGEHPVRLRILGPDSLAPGEAGFVRLHLASPLPVKVGDRFVLRETGRGETIGGGRLLDVDPIVPASRAKPDDSVERYVAERGWVDTDHLERTMGVRAEPSVGRWVVHPPVLETTIASVRAAIEAAGGLGLDLASLDERQRQVLTLIEGAEVDGTHVRIGEMENPFADHPFLAALEASPYKPPTPEGVDRAELREMVRTGLVIESEGIFFAATAVASATAIVARLIENKPDGVTVAEIRESWATTRKYALPLLAILDTTGMTRRRDDVRIAGRRLFA